VTYPIFGDLPALRADTLGFLSELACQPDDVVSLRIPLMRAVLLLGPADIEKVLTTDPENFVKPPWLRAAAVRRLLGEGLVTADGNAWRRQRGTCQPAFHPGQMPAYGEAMAALAERALTKWHVGQVRDVQRDMAHLTLEIAAWTLLGTDIADQTSQVIAAMDALMASFATSPNPYGLLPLPPTVRELRATRHLDRLIDAVIAQAPFPSADSPPTLLALLRAGPQGHDYRALREQIKTFLAAGHESSALVLTWAFVLLHQNHHAEARLAAELRDVLGDRSPTPADLPRLPYTRMVIKETLRLYPPLWMTGRQAARPCEIGGHTIKAGTLILTSQWAVQRRPQFFPDPETFRPERWEGSETSQLPRYAYFPFGGGPRACIGTAFALTESALILAAIACRFRLILDPPQEVRPWATMTLRPVGIVPMRVESRWSTALISHSSVQGRV
jgi:cytochrome P450